MGTRILGYRERQVLEYVRCVISESGVAPSYRMICSELDIRAPHYVSRIVSQLERRGLLRRAGAGRVRRIQLGTFQ